MRKPNRRAQLLARLGWEFSVIVLGVLVALAAQRWYEARNDRATEAVYLERLKESVEDDTTYIGVAYRLLSRKESGLAYLAELVKTAPSAVLTDTMAFLTAVEDSHHLGWTVPFRVRATFQELISTGRIALIRDPTLRSKIVEYYEVSADNQKRIEARRTLYPPRVQGLLPARAFAQIRTGQRVAPELVGAALDEIREPAFPTLLNAEGNYAN